MHGQDRRMRRNGLPGNVCRVALRLDGGLDTSLLRRRVAESPILDWLGRVRIVRSLPLMPPRWEAAAEPKTILFEHNGAGRDVSPRRPPSGGNGRLGEASLPEANGASAFLPPIVAGRDLQSAEGPSLALDLVSRKDGSKDLVISWNHALMDARGVEFLLRHLNGVEAVKGTPSVDDLINPAQQVWNLSKWWNSVKLARTSMEWLRKAGSEPLFTLMPGLRPVGPCRGQQRLISFTDAETARIEARCHNLNAAFRRSQLYLASAIRALHTVAQARGNKDEAYLMPVPHDMRRRGGNGPIFSNQLSILFYRIEARQAASLRDTIAELTRQMMNQIRDRFPEACMAALDMFKPLPLDYYERHLGQPTRGKFASLCFSDSGETCAGMTHMLGGRITEVTHLVPTWRPPGLTVLFWSFSGRPRVLLSWVDDCLSSSEVRVLEQGLRSALLEEEIA
jgi:hypothetical protein